MNCAENVCRKSGELGPTNNVFYKFEGEKFGPNFGHHMHALETI